MRGRWADWETRSLWYPERRLGDCFSPGEYLDKSGAVSRAAAGVETQIYITSSSDTDEIRAGRAILSLAPARIKTQFPTLIDARNSKGSAEN